MAYYWNLAQTWANNIMSLKQGTIQKYFINKKACLSTIFPN